MFHVLFLFIVFGSNQCREIPTESRAKVVESPQVIIKNEGENVTLPCAIQDVTEQDTIIWNRGPKMHLLYVGDFNLPKDVRLSRDNDSSNPRLNIVNLTVEDAGKYTCQIGPKDTSNAVVHVLQVRQKPKVTSFSPKDEVIDITKDDRVNLTCGARGKPDPKITWYHKPLPDDDEKRVVGHDNVLVFSEIDPRKDSGNYTCEASNEVGFDEHTFEMNIRYKPEIVVDNPVMHAGRNADTHLICRVYGNPSPIVEWTRERDSKRISVSEGEFIVNKHKNGEATLTIRSTSTNDFDNYTCIAHNSMGQAMAKIEVVGTPSRPRILSLQNQFLNEPEYTVEWDVISNYDVANYHLKYRLARYNDSVEPGQWISIEVPAVENELSPMAAREEAKEFIHKKKYTIKDIEMDTKYELQVQANNEHGEGLPSEIFPFTVYLPHHQGSFSSAVLISFSQSLPLFLLTATATLWALKQDY